MTFVEYRGARPADAYGAGRWWPGRLHHWRRDEDGWQGFYWPEDAPINTPRAPGTRKPKGAPEGWLPLDRLRPAEHHIDQIRSPVGYGPGDVELDWWPEVDD